LAIGETLNTTDRIVDPDPSANSVGKDRAQQTDRPSGGALTAPNNCHAALLSSLSPCSRLPFRYRVHEGFDITT
jgi:hypothetical protein